MTAPAPLIGGAIDPAALDEARAAAWMRDLLADADARELPRLAAFLRDGDPRERARLGAVMDLSPHLNGTILRHPDWLEPLFAVDAATRIGAIVAALGDPLDPAASESSVMGELRRAKAEACLLIALRDLFGAADACRTTADLSALAEATVGRALRFCLSDLERRGALRPADPNDPEAGCGLFVLGMGKLGGRELNYSSDIDLILFFDPAAAAIVDPAEGVETFSRLARRLVRMVGDRTGEGYAFRTDLRLRPDPSAMPLAIPVTAALGYYEASGRDWERAAMIKARAIAGDRRVADEFLRELSPFVWRRYLDFVAIADIRSMKSRIDTHRGFDGLSVPGHHLKLGPGGIREIEFFAQAQQLIAGGRSPELRVRRTDEALRALAAGGWISPETADELLDAYWFLRRAEHAVQMVADEQVHALPKDEAGLLRIARLLGFPDVARFSDALACRLEAVHARFSRLFAGNKSDESRENGTSALGLLIRGDDPAGLAWLEEAGFSRPGDVGRIVHNWGGGRYRATRSEAAREHLRRVLPALLGALAGGQDPDAALADFDRFLAGLPAGLQFFALLSSNPPLLALLTLAITAAPRLSETIARRPHVFDALLDPAFFAEMPARDLLSRRLDAFLSDAAGYEEQLLRLRIFVSEQRFLIGLRLLSGAIEGERAGEAFSDLAEVALAAALAAVEAEFARAHGRVPGGRLALLGLGRLGSRELTANSDVDLMLLYDHGPQAEESDGARPLPVSVYYTRLTQRLMAALSAQMSEGVLYEVDFRLRPSGNKGPLATHIGAFRKYQAEAWTWERMALTRSRPLAGDPALRREVGEAVRDAIRSHAADPGLAIDVAAMRGRIEREKPARGALDLKLRPGGLIDLEFLAQWSILSGAVGLGFVGQPTEAVLRELAAGRPDLDPGLPELPDAMRAFTRVAQLTRLDTRAARHVAELPRGLADRLARALDLPDAAAVEEAIDGRADLVRAVFARLLPEPDPAGG